MKRALLAIVTGVIILGTVYEKPQAAEPDYNACFGVVLNEDGDGLVLDPETMQPVDPYYNYITYDGWIDAEPGTYVFTLETLNEDGECEERIRDTKADIKPATPAQLAEYRTLGHEYRNRY